MLPKVNFCFEYNGFGRAQTCSYSATIDTPVFMVQTELELAGYEELKFTGYEWGYCAWPGGYPIFYLCADGGVLCPKCANENIKLTTDKDAEEDWRITAVDINDENAHLYCDHCGQRIESAYAEDELDDSMDGDAESALASAGHGTDEDYGG